MKILPRSHHFVRSFACAFWCRVSADNTATILLAETSDGYDARPLKNLIGALAGVDSSHIANMLKVASLTNKVSIKFLSSLQL